MNVVMMHLCKPCAEDAQLSYPELMELPPAQSATCSCDTCHDSLAEYQLQSDIDAQRAHWL